MTPQESYSLLSRCQPPQPLPLVLARLMIATPLGNTERHSLYNRLYGGLSPADKLRCQDELRWCRMGKRGELEAVVSC